MARRPLEGLALNSVRARSASANNPGTESYESILQVRRIRSIIFSVLLTLVASRETLSDQCNYTAYNQRVQTPEIVAPTLFPEARCTYFGTPHYFITSHKYYKV